MVRIASPIATQSVKRSEAERPLLSSCQMRIRTMSVSAAMRISFHPWKARTRTDGVPSRSRTISKKL